MKETICTEQKEREYLFDNYKALLIFLVVMGHFIELASENNILLQNLKMMIFSFHMPAFIFISGYFSKKKAGWKSLLKKLVIPYLVFEVLYYLLYTFVIHKETQLWLLYPKFSLWYLMALLVWKIITPYVRKIPGSIILAVFAGLWVGSSGLDDNFLTLPRMIVFYPFFLLGVQMKREQITKLRKRVSHWQIWLMVMIIGWILGHVLMVSCGTVKIFYGRYDYASMHQSVMEGVVIRLLCYLIAAMITLAILAILPQQACRFSCFGSRTLAIYLFHGLFYSCVKEWWGEIGWISLTAETLLLPGISILLTVFLSWRPFTDLLNRITR